jgi:hypothetical protein
MSTRVRQHQDAVVARVAALAAEGLTTREIGERLGMTRYQVLGICYRRDIALLSRARRGPAVPAPPRAIGGAGRWPMPDPCRRVPGSSIAPPSLAQLMGRR